MATISSPGLGSGLDVSSIVTGKIRMKVTSSDLRQGVEAALDVV